MFDNEQISQQARRPEYDERDRAEYPSPYDGMAGKIVTPKRFWTRTKIISAIVLVIVLLGGIVCISESITIQQRQYDIQGKIGNVWNEVDRASQLLQQSAALLNATIASQNNAIKQIAQARSNVTTIKTSQGTTDPNAALSAANQMTGGLRVFVESYPDYGVGSNSHSLLVQMEGSFNRIEYARGQLIATQTDFNQWLLTQIPMNLFYHPVQILGANTNPAEQMPMPHYMQPTP